MSSCGSYSTSFSYGPCLPSPHSAVCQASYNSYQSNKDSLSCSYTQTHHTGCHTPPVPVSVLTVAMQEAASMGAGVQGAVGCTVDPTAAQIAAWQALAPTDPDGHLDLTGATVNGTTHVLGNANADWIEVDGGDNNTFVVGSGAGDQITFDQSIVSNGNTLLAGDGDGDTLYVNTGDSNVLWAGKGANDTVEVDSGNNNDLHAGSGDAAVALVLNGDNNCLTVGDGNGDGVGIGTGGSNELTAGNGAADILSVDTGDNNLMTAGNGAADQMMVGSGDHNSLIAGNGDGDKLLLNNGDYNFFHAGNGAGDYIQVGTGDFNALIAGNGDGDTLVVQGGNNNVLAEGDGNSDTLSLGIIGSHGGGGDNNILLQGNGANDFIFLGGAAVGELGVNTPNSGNVIVMGNGNGDQAWGSLGNGNSYLTGAGNDLVHTGGGSDFVYVDNHTETSDPSDPYHLHTTDSLAQNLYADGGNDTFAIQGAIVNTSHSCGTYTVGNCYQNAVTFQTSSQTYDSNSHPLGTTVMTGGGGVEKYWVDGSFGNAVITDFNSAHGDRVLVGGVWDGSASTLSTLGPIHTQYITSAYDPSGQAANQDLLITFGSGATQGSITLIDFAPQDTGGAGGAEQFNNVTFNNPAAAEATLAHIFDFSQADNQAVTNQVASLAAANLILH